MSVAVSNHPATARQPRRRVRQEARDAAAVIAFSAGASTSLALVITAVLTLVG